MLVVVLLLLVLLLLLLEEGSASACSNGIVAVVVVAVEFKVEAAAEVLGDAVLRMTGSAAIGEETTVAEDVGSVRASMFWSCPAFLLDADADADLDVGILGNALLDSTKLGADPVPVPEPLPVSAQTRSLGLTGSGGGISAPPVPPPLPLSRPSSPLIPSPRTKVGKVGSGLPAVCGKIEPLFDRGTTPSSLPPFLLAT